MEEYVYERPREKVQRNGVAHLTDVEIMQLIVGSGNAKTPGARLARRITQAIALHKASYDELLSIPGLGVAKVCQVLAVLEWSRRTQGSLPSAAGLSKAIQAAIHEAQAVQRKEVMCYWYDGAQRLIDKKEYTVNRSEHYSLFAKRLFADVVAVSARSVLILFALKSETQHPSSRQLSIVQASRDISNLLSIKLAGVYGVTKSTYKDWGRELL